MFAFIIFSAFYSYRVNSRRKPDDPEKKDYSPYGPWLAPIILPPLFLVNTFFLILSSLAFGFFLVLFPFTLLLFRKPFLIKWILKQALKIGNWVLVINTELLKAAGFHPTPIRLLHERKTPA
jgi:hypothetical protein